jgi:hypothetical protein
MKKPLSPGREWLERIYDRILFDFSFPDLINWKARETIAGSKGLTRIVDEKEKN